MPKTSKPIEIDTVAIKSAILNVLEKVEVDPDDLALKKSLRIIYCFLSQLNAEQSFHNISKELLQELNTK